MTWKTIASNLGISILIGLITAGVSAQTVTFSAVRAELDCRTNGQSIRVLLDTSLKGYLDGLREPFGGQNCDKDPGSNDCKRYRTVRKAFESSLNEVVPKPAPDAQNAAATYSTFFIVELSSGLRHLLKNGFAVPDILDQDPLQSGKRAVTHFTLEFRPTTAVYPDRPMVLMANVKKVEDGIEKSNPHIVKLDLADSCREVPAYLPKVATKDPPDTKDLRDMLVEASKAKAANLGASFALNGSKNNRIYSHDISLEIGRAHHRGLGGAYDIVPFFVQHKYARDEKSPKDDLKFGFRANHLYLFDRDSARNERNLFNSLQTTLSAHIESDFRFSDQVNFVGSWQTGLPINLFDERSSAARVTPFIGYEVGRVLKDESPTTKNGIISRGVVGMDLFLAPWRTEKRNPFEIDIHYIRRLLARQESEYFVNIDGKEVFGGSNRRPKDFVKARLTFNYNDTFAPFFQYSYGREPGKFVLQNSVMEAGLKVYLKWDN